MPNNVLHYFNQPEIIENHGYPTEVHDIGTRDGYILGLHRIVGGRSLRKRPLENSEESIERNIAIKKAVLLLHGFAGSSADYVIGGPDAGLGNCKSICTNKSAIECIRYIRMMLLLKLMRLFIPNH